MAASAAATTAAAAAEAAASAAAAAAEPAARDTAGLAFLDEDDLRGGGVALEAQSEAELAAARDHWRAVGDEERRERAAAAAAASASNGTKEEEAEAEAEAAGGLHPLFMEASDMPADPSAHPDLAALMGLEFEGTPAEVAENHKAHGNSAFAEGGRGLKRGYWNAIVAYGAAIEAGNPSPVARSVYHANRAAANLALENFGRVLEDCRAALRLDPANTKAFFRAAAAANGLRRPEMALRFALGGQALDPGNKALAAQERRARARIAALSEAERRKVEQRAAEREAKRAYTQRILPALHARGIRMGRPILTTQAEYPARVELDQDDDGTGLAPGGAIRWPVMFLYPEHRQSDFIRAVHEQEPLGGHLSYMFPPEGERPPWDKDGNYTLDRIELYVELGVAEPIDAYLPPDHPRPVPEIKKRFLRLKHDTPIHKLLAHKDYIVPHFPLIYVVSKGTTFRDHFLENDDR